MIFVVLKSVYLGFVVSMSSSMRVDLFVCILDFAILSTSLTSQTSSTIGSMVTPKFIKHCQDYQNWVLDSGVSGLCQRGEHFGAAPKIFFGSPLGNLLPPFQ